MNILQHQQYQQQQQQQYQQQQLQYIQQGYQQRIQTPTGVNQQQYFQNAQQYYAQPPLVRQTQNVKSQEIPIQILASPKSDTIIRQQQEGADQFQLLKKRIEALEELNLKLMSNQKNETDEIVKREYIVESERYDPQQESRNEELQELKQKISIYYRELEEKDQIIKDLQNTAQSFSTKHYSIQSLELEIEEKDRLVYRLQQQLQETQNQDYLIDELRTKLEEYNRVIQRLQIENQQCVLQLQEKDTFLNRLQTQQTQKPQFEFFEQKQRSLEMENQQLLDQIRQLKSTTYRKEEDFNQEEILKAKLLEAETEIRRLYNQNQAFQTKIQEFQKLKEFDSENTQKRFQSRYSIEKQELEDQIAYLQRKLKDKDAQNDALTSQLNQVQNALNQKTNEFEMQIRKAQDFSSTKIRDEENKHKQKENQLNDYMNENQRLKTKIFELESRLDQAQQQLHQYERQIQEQADNLNRVQQIKMQIGAERENENKRLGEIEASLQYKDKENENLRNELQKLRQYLAECERKNEDLIQKLSKFQSQKNQQEFYLNQQLKQMQDQLLQTQQKHQELQLNSQEMDEWKNKYQRLESQYQDLKNKQVKLDAELARLQNIEIQFNQAEQKAKQLAIELQKQMGEITNLQKQCKAASDQLNGITTNKQQEMQEIKKWKERALEAEKNYEFQMQINQLVLFIYSKEQQDQNHAQIERLNQQVKDLQDTLKFKEEELLKDKTKMIDMENKFQVDLSTFEGKLNILAAENQSFKKRIEMEKTKNGGELVELRQRVNELLKENEKISHLLYSERNNKDEDFIHYQTVATKVEAENNFLKTIKEDLENQIKNLYEKIRISEIQRQSKKSEQLNDDKEILIRRQEQRIRDLQSEIEYMNKQKENEKEKGNQRQQQNDEFEKQNRVFIEQLKKEELKEYKQPRLISQYNSQEQEQQIKKQPLTKAQQLVGYQPTPIQNKDDVDLNQFTTQLAQTAKFQLNDANKFDAPYSATQYAPQYNQAVDKFDAPYSTPQYTSQNILSQKASIGIMGLPEIPKSFQNYKAL